MGRTASGVKGITLKEGDEVVSMEIIDKGVDLLTVTSKGFGKRTHEEEYRLQNRGGKGIITCKLSEKNGSVVAVKPVTGEEDLMLMTASGVLIRMSSESISQTGRNTQGVKLIRLADEEEVATVARVEKEEPEDEFENEETQEDHSDSTNSDETTEE